MNLDFTPEDQAFRREVREFLAAELPDDIRERVRMGRRLSADDHLRWQNVLSRRGWLAAGWPREHGGPGWGPVERHIFDEECVAAYAPTVVPCLKRISQCAPSRLTVATSSFDSALTTLAPTP